MFTYIKVIFSNLLIL